MLLVTDCDLIKNIIVLMVICTDHMIFFKNKHNLLCSGLLFLKNQLVSNYFHQYNDIISQNHLSVTDIVILIAIDHLI